MDQYTVIANALMFSNGAPASEEAYYLRHAATRSPRLWPVASAFALIAAIFIVSGLLVA